MMPVLISRMLRSSASVLLLDDAHHLAGGVAHDTAVAGGVGQFDGENGQCATRRVQQFPCSVSAWISGTSP
jgi:hypothetical protein